MSCDRGDSCNMRSRSTTEPSSVNGGVARGAADPLGAGGGTGIFVNGKELSVQERNSLQQVSILPLRPGRYWIDWKAYTWGVEGGHCLGQVSPLAAPVGGRKMVPHCSGGGTGVFVNGRELHCLDVAALGYVMPGRYWLNKTGFYGVEGMPIPLGNLFAMGGGGGGSGGSKGSILSTYDKCGAVVL